jgi:hypothetical protein
LPLPVHGGFDGPDGDLFQIGNLLKRKSSSVVKREKWEEVEDRGRRISGAGMDRVSPVFQLVGKASGGPTEPINFPAPERRQEEAPQGTPLRVVVTQNFEEDQVSVSPFFPGEGRDQHKLFGSGGHNRIHP